MSDLEDTAEKIITDFLQVEDETLGLVIDRENEVTDAFQTVAQDFDHRTVWIPEERANNSSVPHLAEELAFCDAIVAPTRNSITHAPETTELREHGKRFITLPGVEKNVFLQILEADQERIRETEEQLLAQVGDAEHITIQTPSGTDLELKLDPDRPWHRSKTTVEPGEVRNLPNGEVFTAPLEDQADGTVVIDIWQDIRKEDKARLEIRDGTITEWTDGAQPLIDLLGAGGPPGRVIAELGIGTNHAHDKPMGITANDEKMYGTCHVAFGMNASFGGENDADVHQDVVLQEPELCADGERVDY